jgi:hypothetical protein
MDKELKLQRTRERWLKSDPKSMAQQSPAAVMYALQDAKSDIEALHRYAEKIRAQPSQGGEAVAWQVTTAGALPAVYVEYPAWAVGDPTLMIKPLYTHPADKVADGVTRELLERIANGFVQEQGHAINELRALLEQKP